MIWPVLNAPYWTRRLRDWCFRRVHALGWSSLTIDRKYLVELVSYLDSPPYLWDHILKFRDLNSSAIVILYLKRPSQTQLMVLRAATIVLGAPVIELLLGFSSFYRCYRGRVELGCGGECDSNYRAAQI